MLTFFLFISVPVLIHCAYYYFLPLFYIIALTIIFHHYFISLRLLLFFTTILYHRDYYYFISYTVIICINILYAGLFSYLLRQTIQLRINYKLFASNKKSIRVIRNLYQIRNPNNQIMNNITDYKFNFYYSTSWLAGMVSWCTDSVVCWVMHCCFDPNQGRTAICAVCMLLCAVPSFDVLPGALIFVWGS